MQLLVHLGLRKLIFILIHATNSISGLVMIPQPVCAFSSACKMGAEHFLPPLLLSGEYILSAEGNYFSVCTKPKAVKQFTQGELPSKEDHTNLKTKTLLESSFFLVYIG